MMEKLLVRLSKGPALLPVPLGANTYKTLCILPSDHAAPASFCGLSLGRKGDSKTPRGRGAMGGGETVVEQRFYGLELWFSGGALA